ncbi:transcription elongation factor GreA [Isachenkonia alkalipeptolytica]|uniref:Transcription elongation factor GreA n=2 Tax=Isachenkonia alkalipeptolytica TaxID=2565777 RepID=A0AA44BFQ5_9CLOT|nr:transcription elongation factor GreA [Isachenkonia alkalipeptolytica]NBG88721.1 transcription elongation factor GreA [Isachenkonia alkalipeptolytica]
MMTEEIVLTVKGRKKIEEELEQLKVVRRKEVAERIKQAIDFGDISENSEYDEAKNEQAQVEERISKLSNILKNAKIVDENDINTDYVSVGTVAKVKDLDDGEILEYTIVGASEADPYELKISNASPIGKALLNQQVGDVVEVKIPDGVSRYEIVDIERSQE